MTMSTESFGDCNKLPYGVVVTFLLTIKDLNWQNFTSQMLENYISLQSAKPPTMTADKKDFIIRSKLSKNKRQTVMNASNEPLCWYCSMTGHIKVDCSRRRRKQGGESN